MPDRNSADAQHGPPNIVLVLLDDVGFGDASLFGGPIATPALERLAAHGLRYNNFHTAAMCSPTRAALLTGRNHHRVGFGFLAESSSAHSGYDGVWKTSTASIADTLRRNGYRTAAFGKWHNTPPREIGPAGPFDRWPTGMGFDYFYGFNGWATSQWEPELFRNTSPVEPPATPEQGYHLTADIVDEAVRWIHMEETLAPSSPYFLYLAPGAAHGPHHVPASWIDKYKGHFDQGWDELREETFARQTELGVVPAGTKLTARPAEIPAWDSLPADQQQLLSRQMEIYAAFVSHTDHEVSRLIEAAQGGPERGNTLILYIVGDNGAAGEGGLDGQMDRHPHPDAALDEQLAHIDELGSPEHDNLYSGGWAWAGSTPFQWFKSVASHFGATCNPMVASWPLGIRDAGGLRSQFAHVTDIAPTLYEVAGVRAPSTVGGIAQDDLDGASFVSTFASADVASSHQTQYFEILGNRAIYHDGWVAAARHWTPAWDDAPDSGFEADQWELYQVDEDFSQAEDLATRHPERLARLRALFDDEALRNDVSPLGGGSFQATNHGDADLVFYPDMPRLPTRGIPGSITSTLRVTAEAVIPAQRANGVILSYGGRWEGFVLFAKNGRVTFENHFANSHRDRIVADTPLPEGPVTVALDFTADRDGSETQRVLTGDAVLSVDGQVVGRGRSALKGSLYYGSLGVGRCFGSSVSSEFDPPFDFTGMLSRVSVSFR